MDEFMNLVYPLEILNEKEKLLRNYYVEQYGEDMRQLIEKRENKTIYLFTSPPDVTFKYLVENDKYVIDWEYFSEVEEYYKDYIELEKEINEKRNRKLFYLFCNLHNISFKDYLHKEDEILDLINNSFFDSCYKEKCDDLGIKALTNKKVIETFNKKRDILVREANGSLITRSLWGQDIRKSFLDMHIGIDDDVLCNIIGVDNDMIARCCNFRRVIIVFVPMIKTYLNGGNVDRIFLHENRHAVESGDVIGINGEDCLNILNEVRTEKHAIEDDNELPTIFSKSKTENIDYYYEKVFPCCEEILGKYSSLIDRCAIENNMSLLFDTFGREDICRYGKMLEVFYKKIRDFLRNGSGYLEVNIDEHLNLEQKLMDKAYKNGYLPYQKVKK